MSKNKNFKRKLKKELQKHSCRLEIFKRSFIFLEKVYEIHGNSHYVEFSYMLKILKEYFCKTEETFYKFGVKNGLVE